MDYQSIELMRGNHRHQQSIVQASQQRHYRQSHSAIIDALLSSRIDPLED
jgi:hypothetical protein